MSLNCDHTRAYCSSRRWCTYVWRATVEKCPIATSSTTNSTWTESSANPGIRGDRPATNRLSHDTTSHHTYSEDVTNLKRSAPPSHSRSSCYNSGFVFSGGLEFSVPSHLILHNLWAEKASLNKLRKKQSSKPNTISLQVTHPGRKIVNMIPRWNQLLHLLTFAKQILPNGKDHPASC
jgi:hypothetical protein